MAATRLELSRRSLAAALVVLAGVSVASAHGMAAADRGRAYGNVPPSFQGFYDRNNWRGDWFACAGETMQGLARDPDVRLSLSKLRAWQSISPQYTARMLAYVVEQRTGLNDDGSIDPAALDGCRNGILWRYYHPNNKR
jgi:hypothetical protein